MRRRFSYLLTVILIVVFLLPSGAFAMDNKDLENAISTTKSLLNITTDYDTFSYSISKQDDITVYNLYWSDSKQKLGNINASIDSLGRLTNYYSYKPYDQSYGAKFPQVSKNDALKTANDFIKKVNPTVFEKIQCQESDTAMYVTDTYYYFNYYRIENGVTFPENSVYVSVSNRTGEVTNYNCNWTDGLTFPDLSGIVSKDDAQKAYTDKIGLQLIYRLSSDNDNPVPYLVYTIMNTNRCIDAKTGEAIPLSNIYYGREAQNSTADMGKGINNVELSPEEIKALDNASEFLSEKEVEDIVRKTLELDDGYTLDSINLYKVWQSKTDYVWNMYFSKTIKDSSKPGEDPVKSSYYSAHVSVDAKTGEITNFYKSVPGNSDDTVKYDKDQSKKIAEDFIKFMQPANAVQVKYTTWNEPDVKPLDNETPPRNYSFTFTRLANNFYFPGNGFTISVDAVTGAITDYSYTWYKGELNLPKTIITIGDANNILYGKIGLKLQYIADYSESNDVKAILPVPEKSTKPQIKLVYTLESSKPANIDAVTGKILDYAGKPYVENTIVQYSDISGNPAENIIKYLAQYGISLPGDEFKPAKEITQKEFLYLVAKSMGWYQTYEDSETFNDSLYNYLVSMKVVKDGERNPAVSVTKQDASRFFVRALKYDRVADIKALFNLSFKDSSNIGNDYYGYVAIAYGLGIIGDNDEYFNPTDNITRTDAAKYIYNILNIGY